MNYEEETTFMHSIDEISAWLNTPKAYILNPEKAMLLKETCNHLQELLDVENVGCTVDVKPCPLGLGDIVISFEIADFVIRDTMSFYSAVQYLDNFEIYACEDRKIRFSGIMSKVALVAPLADKI